MANRPVEKSLIVLLLLLLTATLSYTNVLSWRFDQWIYDTQLTLLATPASRDIVIVEVDQNSLSTLGRWPWPRDIHARLLETLTLAHPYVIGMDFVFSEADTEHPELDTRLSQALASSKPVVLPVLIEHSGNGFAVAAPLTEYARHATVGHANVEIDQDGISRSVFLQAKLNSLVWPAMPLAIYAAQHPEIMAALPGVPNPQQQDGLTKSHRVWLPFFNPGSDFTRVSYADVLAGLIPKEYFTDKYVLVGLTAKGFESDLATPLAIGNRTMSGVDFMASCLDGLIKQTLWQPLPTKWQWLLNLAFCGIAIKISTSIPQGWLAFAVVVSAMSVLLFSLVMLHVGQYWFAPSAAFTVLLASYPLRSWRLFEKLLQSLFAERKRAQITLNAIVDGVIATNANGIIDYMNAAAHDITGGTLDKAKNQHVDQIFSVDIDGQTHKLGELIQLSIRHNGSLKFNNCRITVCEQHIMSANLTITPLLGSQGQLLGTVLTINDIGERIMMTKMLLQKDEEQTVLQALINRAEQISLAKSQFLSHMSHELRTPLNAIIGFTQLMQMDDPDNPLSADQLDSVNEILKASNHLLGLINELLDLAKIESGKISVEISGISLSALLSDCQALINPLALSKGLKLQVENALSNDILLEADPKRAKQILLNFLSNALKYNRAEGSIQMTAIQIDADKVRIAVTDTGQGLAEQEQQLLFQSFQRLGAEHTEIEGTGIGLSISKQLAELMHGSVGVYSTLGVGSTFWVELPILS